MLPVSRGRWRVAVFSLVFLILGSLLSYVGWSALIDGQVLVLPKRDASYIATAEGPHSLTYYFHAYGLTALGTLTLVIGVIPAWWLFYGLRKMKGPLGQPEIYQSDESNAPRWLVLLTLGTVFTLIGYGFYRAA